MTGHELHVLNKWSTLMKCLRVNEKPIYVIDITFGTNESIFSGNEQQKV